MKMMERMMITEHQRMKQVKIDNDIVEYLVCVHGFLASSSME